jgi:GWxTD domain-containing protein
MPGRCRIVAAVCALLLGSASIVSPASAQERRSPLGEAVTQPVLPEFFVDVMCVRSADQPGRTQLDIYTRIPFNRLTFLNSPEGFKSDYVVTVEALARIGDQLTSTPVETRIWEASASADAYVITQSEETSTYTTQSLFLEPGPYQLSVQIEDRNSSQVFVRDLEVVVRDVSKPIGLSDVVVLDHYDEQALEYIPRVSNQVGTDEGSVQLFYESYANRPTIVRMRQELIRLPRDGGMASEAEEIEGEEPLPLPRVYEEDLQLTIEPGRSQHVVTLPLGDVEVGPHLIRIRMEDEDGVLIDEAVRFISAQWNGLERHITDLDEAIDQLEYTAKPDEITFIRDATSEATRYQRFRSFWDKHDPTPGTRRNEGMEEYYYRMFSANQRYTSQVQGWRTDRGLVLVRFGEPEFIRKKPHSFNYEPYEVWVYERIGRQFIFIDKTGFGDYQLLVPIWDERTRLY